MARNQKPIVGYLRHTRDGLIGETGLGYSYLLASNGLFIRAENALLRATIQVAPAEVRGLAPLTESLELVHGRIPWSLVEATTNLYGLDHELYMAVAWQAGAYQRVVPSQTGSPASVQYQRPRGVLLDVHTHGSMGAFFSSTDDADEQGFQLYAVLGRLDLPVREVGLRLGVHGYFAPLDWGEVFDRPPPLWLQVVTGRPTFVGGEARVPPDGGNR